MTEATDRTFEDVRVGDCASITRTFTDTDIRTFADLSGDLNPLHVDPDYARQTPFGRPIAHGMLTASLISTMLGMHLPGKRCLILKETLTFRKPVYAGDALEVIGTVIGKSESTRTIEVSLVIQNEDVIVVDGAATVQLI